MRLLILAIIILIIARILWRMIMGPMRRPRQDRRARGSMPLVRDPVCGTYLLPDRAIKTGSGDSVQYFCSEACRDKYHGGAPS